MRPARKHNGVAGWAEIGVQRCYFRSKLERRHAEFLELQRGAGLIREWQHEPRTFHFPDRLQAPVSYKPDFRVVWCSGVEEWHECKGHWTRRDVTKLRLMARHYPEITIAVVGARLTSDDKEAIERARELTIAERAKAERKATAQEKRSPSPRRISLRGSPELDAGLGVADQLPCRPRPAAGSRKARTAAPRRDAP